MGDEDHVRHAVETDGEINYWKVAIKPGKPLAYGRIAQADFFGLPGNPVSAFVTFLLMVKPFIRACQGVDVKPPTVLKILTSAKFSQDCRGLKNSLYYSIG